MFRILKTDGGPHPADKWAMTTAEFIFQTAAVAPGDRTIAARKVQIAIAEALEKHHQAVQDAERGHLKTHGDAHLDTDYDAAEQFADAAMSDVVAAGKGSPWEALLATPEWQEAARVEIIGHMKTSMHIDRHWHADRAQTPAAKAWKSQHTTPPPAPAAN